jgi:hypothetical protein
VTRRAFQSYGIILLSKGKESKMTYRVYEKSLFDETLPWSLEDKNYLLRTENYADAAQMAHDMFEVEAVVIVRESKEHLDFMKEVLL